MSVPSNNPETPATSGKELDKDEIIELLGDEAEEKPLELDDKPKKREAKEAEGKPEGDEEVEEEDTEDELKAIEEELEEPKEEDLELMTPVRRREILAKYPKLFKDFPYLEKAYYREQQFTELLPTIQDAKIAVEKASVLDNFERQLMDGDISNVLKAVKTEDEESFNKIVDNYLPTLLKTDERAYYHVLGGVVKDTIVTMVREARSMGEQGTPLLSAANILNQFVFGTNKFTPHQRLAKETSPEDSGKENELKVREQEILTGQFESARGDLQTRTDNVLKATIDEHIDPKKTMTDYVRKNALKDAYENLEDLISKDTRFRSILDKLWEKAFEQKFNKESTDRIKSAYLSKAKQLLPTVIKKARNDALKGMGKRVVEDEDDDSEKSPSVRGQQPVRPGKLKSAKDIPRGKTTLEVLMED